MEIVQSIGAPLNVGFRELRLQEVEKQSCMIDRGLGVLPHPSAQTCCSTPMALFMWIGASQVGNWPYSFHLAMEVQWQLSTLSDFRRYAQDGFLEVSQPSTDVKGKPSVLNWWSVLMLRGRPFCPGSSQVTKPGLTIMSRRRKGSQWSGIIRNHQGKRSSRQLLPPERSWSPSFGTLMEWFWWMWWPEVRQPIRTRTSKPSKNWKNITGDLTGMKGTCWFSTKMPALTQIYESRRKSPNFVGLCSPLPPIVLTWCRRFSSFWATEGCTAWVRVWRWPECDSCSEDMATWTGNELVQGSHACPCFALALRP